MTDYPDVRVSQRLSRLEAENSRLQVTVLRVTELARRWERTPGRQDAARQLLTALGLRKERE